MRLTFIGAAHEVTGSCYFLEAAGKKFVRCLLRMEQGPDQYENQDIPVALSDLDFALLTHAHIDHSGNFPRHMQRDSEGRYMPQQPPAICAILCFVTAPTFRCLRQSGETVRQDETDSRSLCQLIPWKML